MAVLAVILFHLDLLPWGRGYLGVDVFFVISGYLIGGRLADAAAKGWHGLLSFWRRRIVRLWPAASVTMLLSWLAAALVLDRYEYHAFLWQLLGGSTLAANLVLWKQISYFSHDAVIKPLLHMWSLAVEEQFYLALPLVFLLPRGRLLAASLLSLLSVGIWVYTREHAPSSSFYLLPARAWELGAGVVICLAERRWSVAWRKKWPRPALIGELASLALIWLLCFGGIGSREAPAMMACVALSALVLVCPGQAGRRPPGLLVALGDRSYALYLVHWPLIALAHNLWMKALPKTWVVALAVAILVLGDVLFRLIDRRRRQESGWLGWFLLHAGLAIAAGMAILSAPSAVQGGNWRQPNEGLGQACNNAEIFDPAKACKSGPHPHVLVWGDSFAMQLVPGLAARIPGGVLQATHVVCGPLMDVAPVNDAYPKAWAQGCLRWNASVLGALRRDPQIRVVILASILSQYVEEGESGWQVIRPQGDGRLVVGARRDDLLVRDLHRTIAAIRAMGREVWVYRPQPYANFDIGRCLARRADRLAVMDAPSDCSFAADAMIPVGVDRWLKAALAPEEGGLFVLDPWPALCQGGRCVPMRNGYPLFADRVHLSRPGSVWVAQRLSMPPDMIHRPH